MASKKASKKMDTTPKEMETVSEMNFNLGKEILDYAKKFEGKRSYNEILLAIEFGYNLALKYEIEDNGKKADEHANY